MAEQQVPRVAAEYVASNTAEIGAATSAVQRLWSRMDPADLDGSYAAIEPTLLAVWDTAQDRMQAAGTAYVPAVMRETGQRLPLPAYSLAPGALVGTAGDGRSTEGLAYRALIGTKVEIATSGTSAEAALLRASRFLTRATGTLMSDTHRTAERVAGASRGVALWVRVLVPPSCGRCVVLAGRVTGNETAFLRHPQCFPEGVTVSGPAVEAATRRWYEGELTILHTASGKRLPATGNHPVLTDQGWIPANLVREGDHVIGSTLAKGAVPLVVPDEHQTPTLIEDVRRSLGVTALGRVPSSAEDFHGDGGQGEVDVVFSDRLLRDRGLASLHEFGVEESLAGRVEATSRLSGGSPGDELIERHASSAHGAVGGGGLSLPLLGGHLPGAHLPGLGRSADRYAVAGEVPSNHAAADAVASGEAVLALSAQVGGGDLIGGQREDAPRWDAPAVPFAVESRGAYAGRGVDLLERLSGQVSRDRVVKVERVQWSGHVYNLTSAEGWFSANGLIVSNCDCTNVPATPENRDGLLADPHAYLDDLSDDDLARTLGSRANARAFRDGADQNQLVNAYRRGGDVRPAQVYGRNVKYTTEGVTRRGLAGQRMRSAGLASEGEVKRGRYLALKAPRLMPESIYQIATSPEDAQRLLRLYGWIL